MLLAIDAGNTNVVFAIFDGPTLRGAWRAATDTHRTADEYAVWLSHLMAIRQLSPGDITDTIIASVVPDMNFSLTTLAREHFKTVPRMVGEPGLDLGIENKLDRPDEVGADRLVNAVAAKAAYAPPLIVIDFGTATTFDVVNTEGDYIGGVIAPGINLSVEALARAAARLPRVAVKPTQKVIGDNTTSAMQSGVYWGYIGLIEGLVGRIRGEFGSPMTIVATGGLAPLFANATSVIEHIEPELTLTGLRLIHERNTAAPC